MDSVASEEVFIMQCFSQGWLDLLVSVPGVWEVICMVDIRGAMGGNHWYGHEFVCR